MCIGVKRSNNNLNSIELNIEIFVFFQWFTKNEASSGKLLIKEEMEIILKGGGKSSSFRIVV